MKKLIYAIAAGGIGYLIYTKFKDGKAKDIAEESTETTALPVPSKTTSTTPALSDYKKKVMELQGLLKVGIDGAAGSQTNGALENLWSSEGKSVNSDTAKKTGYPNLKKNGKGVVSASNVNYYIAAIKNKTNPLQLFYKKQATQSQSASVSKDAIAFKNKYASSGNIYTKNAAKYQVVIKDNSRNKWLPQSKYYSYGANSSFITPVSYARNRVKIVDVIGGNLYISVDEVFKDPYILVVPASSVYLK